MSLYRIHNGLLVENFRDTLTDDKNTVQIIKGKVDPTAVGIDSPRGSLFLRTDTGDAYMKTGTIGHPTGWKLLISSSGASIEDGFQNIFLGKSEGSTLPEYSTTYVVSQNDDIVTAIGKLDSTIGDVPLSTHYISDTNTVNQNISALDANAFTQAGTIALKAPINNPAFTGTVTGITPTMVNLGNLTNDAQVKRSEMGASLGVATLGSDSKLTSTQIPTSLLGQVTYIGTWNANTNTPSIQTASSGNKGWYYIVNTAGSTPITTSIGLISMWDVGDWIVSDGTYWDKIDNTDAVSSVNGHTGIVTLTATDVGLGNVNNTADASKVVLSASKLTTPRNINGISFDGTSDITVSDSTKVVANTAISAGTAAKITYDAKGLVLSGTTLAASDIPSLTASKISDFSTATMATTLGTVTPTNSALTSGDNLTTAFNKIQGQINSATTTVTLTNDVTGSGNGTVSTTISAGAVTLAKMANLAANSIIGNNTGSSTTPIALTTTQTKTLLALNNVENTALSTWAGSGNISTVGTVTSGTWTGTAIASANIASALTGKTYNALSLTAQAVGFTISGGTTSKILTVSLDATVSGTNTGDQTITLTSDVTGSGTGSFAVTIASGAVTLAKMANLAANSFIGNNTGSAATPLALTTSQAKTLLAISTSDVSGLTAWATKAYPSDVAGLLRNNGSGTLSWDTSAYITGNQSITLSGDVTGTGTTAITTAISASVVTGKALTSYALGSNNAISAADTILSAFGKVQAEINAREASLGNPSVDGYVLSSTAAGVRSWISAGGSVSYNAITSVPANSILGNNTGSTSNAISLSATQAKSLLGITTSDISDIATNYVSVTSNANVLYGDLAATGIYQWTSPGLFVASSTTFNVSALSGWIVNNTTDPMAPTFTKITYAGASGITPTYLNTNFVTYLMISSAGALIQQAVIPTPQQRRDNLYIGRIVHPNKVSIQNVGISPDLSLSIGGQFRDIMSAIKFVNGGISVSPASTDLTIQNTAGYLYGIGLGFISNSEDPSRLYVNSASPTTFQYRTLTEITTSNMTSVDGTHYDNAGTITAIAGNNNQATNQRVFVTPGGLIRLQYGQTIYTSITNAIAGIGTESFITAPSFIDNALLIGILVVRKGASNLSLTTDARFLSVSKFGDTFGGSAGIPTTTLQQAYNNSSVPQIITNATLGALEVQRGSAADTDDVLQVLNGAGTKTLGINGNGAFTTPLVDSSDPSAVYQVTINVDYSTSSVLTLSGSQTVDGGNPTTGQTVLARGNTTANGVYIVNTAGAWTRHPLYVTGQQVQSTAIYVKSGATNAGWTYRSTFNAGVPVVGTSSLTYSVWMPFSNSVAYSILSTSSVGGFLGHSGTSQGSISMISSSTQYHVPQIGSSSALSFGYLTAGNLQNSIQALSATSLTLGGNASNQMTFGTSGSVDITASSGQTVNIGSNGTAGIININATATTVTVTGGLTVTGTLTLPTQTSHYFFAAPIAGGVPSFRAIDVTDIQTATLSVTLGTVTPNNATLASGDTLSVAFNKTQGQINAKEASLGNPSVDGYVLSSTAAGVRSWVVQSGGGGSVAYNSITSVPANSIIGNNTGSVANASALSATQVKSLLGITTSDVSGLTAWATKAYPSDTTGLLRNNGTGTLSWDTSAYITSNQTITLSNDITGSGSTSISTTISAGAVSLTKMAALAANSFIGNNTVSPATPIALTTTQAKTLLGITTSDVSGLTAWATATYPTNAPGYLSNDGSGNLTWYSDTESVVVTNDTTIRTANTVFSAPDGSSGVAIFRNLVSADFGNSITATASTNLALGANATSGILTIAAANVTSLVPLTATELLVGTLGYTPANPLLLLGSISPGYVQGIIQNKSPGTSNSADIIVNNDVSTDSTFYGDFGINSSTFSGSGSFSTPNSVYLTSTSGDLAIGTTTANAIHFATNGSTSDAMTISSAGLVSFYGNVTGAVNFQGYWNASTNTPSIPAASTTNEGWYYVVSVAGTTVIGSHSSWAVGDWLVSNGTSWDFITNTFTGNGNGTLVLNSRSDTTGVISSTDYLIRYTGNTNITYTLPAATGSDRFIRFIHGGAVGTTVTVIPNGTDLVNGDGGVTMTKNDPLDIIGFDVCDSSTGSWLVT